MIKTQGGGLRGKIKKETGEEERLEFKQAKHEVQHAESDLLECAKNWNWILELLECNLIEDLQSIWNIQACLGYVTCHISTVIPESHFGHLSHRHLNV